MHMSIDLSNSYLETAIVTERHNMGVYGICKWGGTKFDGINIYG